MAFIELFLIAIGLSMDAFAVSACIGLAVRKATVRKAVVIGLYFGIFQAGMPLIGYMAATLFAGYIIAYNHWIAFALLCFIGGRMVIGSFRENRPKNKTDDSPVCGPDTHDGISGEPLRANTDTLPGFGRMLPLAVATSIDALAAGVSFAFLQVSIVPAVLLIGATTFLLSMLGLRIGNIFGSRFKPAAELAGGVILILLGLKILLEHTGMLWVV